MNIVRRGRRRALLTAAALVGSLLTVGGVVSPNPAAAAGETIISTFYVPIFEDNAYSALFAVNGATGAALSSTTSITVKAAGTIIYYDQWEDGYEAAANVKTQTSTLVFGDGNTANGDASTYCFPARCAGDLLPDGAVLRLNNSTTITPGSVTVPRSTGTVVFDGRDKISATAGLSVTHATWPTNTDALHSEMSAALDTTRWGTNFVAPVGTTTPQQNADGLNHFSYAGIEVMAKAAGTVVSIDANGDGDYLDANDINGVTIGEGQVIYVNGNVAQGAKVVASKPVQTQLLTGRIGSNYEDRSYQLFPTEGLVNDYVAPASAVTGSAAYPTVLYLYNPQVAAISVTVTTPAGATVYSIPAGQVLNPAPFLNAGQGARVTSTSTFAAVAAIGTRDGANGQNYDWGYSLTPARLLLSSINVGWAPGSQDLTSATYDPVWLTAAAPTTVYIDYDGDPTTGSFVDPNGAKYDTTVTVSTALTVTKITDSSDNDMTGARIYTVDGVGIAAAYGEDPSVAPVAFPGIDLGTALFPACGALCVQKTVKLLVDANGNGLIDPGDTVQWTVVAANTGYYALTNPILKDTLTAGVTYVPGSTTLDTGAGAAGVADDVVPTAATLFPYDESGRTVGTIAVGGSATVKFNVVVDNPYTGPTGVVKNTAIVLSDQANGGDTSTQPINGLRLTKTSNGNVPVKVGDALTYTLTASNQGSSTLSNIAINDPLPAGLTWASTSVTRPATTTSTIADNFESSGYSGSTGSVAWSDSSWTEVDTGGAGAAAGYVQNVTDLGDRSIRFGDNSPVATALSRTAGNLSTAFGATLTFERRCSNFISPNAIQLQIRPTAAAAWTTLNTWSSSSCTTDAAYVPESYTLASGTQFGTATQIQFVVTGAFTGSGTHFFYVDNVQFNLSSRTTSTVAGAAAPNLVTLTDLLPGESATIVVNTTVASVPNADIINTATATSGAQSASASVTDCSICYDFGDAPATYNGGGTGLNPARARVRGQTTLIADTFQSGGYSGSTGTAAWSQAVWTETDSSGAAQSTTAGFVQNVIDSGARSVTFTASSPLTTAISRIAGDLSAYTTGVTLGVDYRCDSMEADDEVTLEVRKDASSAWSTPTTWSNCSSTAYTRQTVTLNQATQVGTATEIRFRISNAFETGDAFYLSGVQFTAVSPTNLTGLRLGSLIDREAALSTGAAPASAVSGSPATGDNTTGVNDEDGVTVPSVDANTMTIPFTVSNAAGGVSYVNGWFDWNNNGVFDSNESVFDPTTYASSTGGITVVSGVAQVPSPGSYSVTINVPDLTANGSGYAIGNTVYSRFRVATQRSEITTAVGASSDGEVEDYNSALNTLPVNVAYFASQRSGGNVAIDWRTAQEVDNLGFNLYAKAPKGDRVLLTPKLVLAKAPSSVTPQSYKVTLPTDTRVLWLQDIALDGTPAWHGPYTVGKGYGDPNPPKAIDWGAAQSQVEQALIPGRKAQVDDARAASKQRAAAIAAAPATAVTGAVARLDVTQAGIQEVTYAQLLAIGVDLAGTPARSLAITDQNGPVPVEVTGPTTFGAGSTLRFYGAPLNTLYTSTNVYRIQINPALVRTIAFDPTPPPGTPAATTSTTSTTSTTTSTTSLPPTTTTVKGKGKPPPPTTTTTTAKTTTTTAAPTTTTTTVPTPVVPVTAYAETATVENNVSYSVTAPGSDPWYDRVVFAQPDQAGSESQSVNVVDPVVNQPAIAAVELWGITRSAVLAEHHVQLSVNGVHVADARFDDTQALRLQGLVPAGVLLPGANTLAVTLVGDTGVPVDIVAINTWSITFARKTVAVDGRLDMTTAGQRVDVTGLPAGSVLAYRFGAGGSLTKLNPWSDGTTTYVAGTVTAQRYVFAAASALRTPTAAPMRPAANLLTGPADYLMITHGALAGALTPLVAYHRSQGHTVKVVDIADIYEAYSGGVVDARAIKTYLAAAIPKLGTRWVLLVGADTIDYRNYEGNGSFSLIPSLYGATGFSVTYAPIDPAYVDINNDGVPDAALGRMPARTPAELSTMITKTMTYDTQQPGRSVLLASDQNDGVDYAAANDAIAAEFGGWSVRRSDIDRQGIDAAAAELLAGLNAGVDITMYLGHSGTQEWTEAGLFNAGIASTLTNASHLTVVAQFGCWNTYYVAPAADTLGHALLLDPNGGAAAVMGASTLTSSANDIALAGLLAGRIAGGHLTVGEAMLAAKVDLTKASGGSTADMQLGWTLLGDPAMMVGR